MKYKYLRSFCMLVVMVASSISLTNAYAAELRLRTQCVVSGPLVKLGDVADIAAADPRQAEALAAIELFPAPAGAEQRFVRVREIQDLLLLHGVNLAEQQFSGSSQVTVTAANSRPVRPQTVRPVSSAEAQRVNRRVAEAVVKYIEQHAATREPWVADVQLSEDRARMLVDPTRPIAVSGGQEPWSGSQRFEITVQSPQGPARFEIEAQIHIPAPVVVAVRSLSRGDVIREGDVEMQRASSALSHRASESPAFHSVEEVLGREIVRAIPAGKAISPDSLRSPLMVRRGDVVTVFANNAGIRVRTNARARDEGGQGELVAVESLLDRSTYYARVSGVREVEVYARSASAERADLQESENVVRR